MSSDTQYQGITVDEIRSALDGLYLARQQFGEEECRMGAIRALRDLYYRLAGHQYVAQPVGISALAKTAPSARNFVGAECPKCGEILAVRISTGAVPGSEVYWPECPVCAYLPDRDEYNTTDPLCGKETRT